MDNQKGKIAIIGNGCAGAESIKALRNSGFGGEIHVFTESKWPAYNPMLTTYYASGKIGFEQLFPFGSDGELDKNYHVITHSGSPVTALDAEKKTIVNKNGFEFSYDKCLVATGASAFVPPIEGAGSEKVYTMRTVEDAMKLREAMDKKPRKAIVIGASMVGIKLVEMFHKAGMTVCLADMAERIFPLAAHPDCAKVIEDRLVEMGIKLRFCSGIKKIEDVDGGVRAYFDNGTEVEEADILLMCIGVRTNTSFLDKNQVEMKQGILVDEHMRTNVPDLYAAGDVAQGKNLLTGQPQIIGLWANARYQGRTAGNNMAGVEERYPGNILHNITHFMGMDFVGIGDITGYDRMEKRYDGKEFIQLFWRDNMIIGANLIDAFTEAGVIKNNLVRELMKEKPEASYSQSLIQEYFINKVLAEVKRT